MADILIEKLDAACDEATFIEFLDALANDRDEEVEAFKEIKEIQGN